MRRFRPLPTLLGALLLLAGVLAFSRSGPNLPPPPERVAQGLLPTTVFEATLVAVDEAGERLRQERLEAPPEPGAQLTESLRALRSWLTVEGTWPDDLGAPRVFLLSTSYAVLDFPLAGTPRLSAAAEGRLLGSVQRTAARRGIGRTSVLINGRTAETFLGHLALSDVVEVGPVEVSDAATETAEVLGVQGDTPPPPPQ